MAVTDLLLEQWIDEDLDVTVEITPAPVGSISSWPFTYEVRDMAGTLMFDLTTGDGEIVVDDAEKTLNFVFAMDGGGLVEGEDYKFRTRRTDLGSRGVLNSGILRVLKR